MNLKILSLCLVFSVIFHTVWAQEDQRCHSFEFLQNELEHHPELKQLIEAHEYAIQTWIKEHPANGYRTIATIPVVVHIVFPPGQLNTVTAEDVVSQIDILNEDYRRQNADVVKTPSLFTNDAADTEIQFCLAKRTPDNQPTTGILYEPNDIQEWDGSNFDVLKQYAWPKDKYLNIWVCKMGSNVIGYATFPITSEIDGVVITNRAFGRVSPNLTPIYSLGRTGTHEVAHWLNCYHVNGDDGTQCSGSDFCDDTPNQAGQNYGCPSFPKPSCSNTSDMFMNYLDYTRDSCMNIFTNCQKQRMWATLNGIRASLLNSPGCNPVVSYQNDIWVSGIIYPSGTVTKRSVAPQVRITNNGVLDIDSCILHYGFLGQDKSQYKWKGKLSAGASEIVVLPKIMDSIGYSIFTCKATYLNGGVVETDTVNNFMTRRIYVPADAIKDTVGKNVLIYPNPSSGTYILKFDSLVADDYTVDVFNLVGQMIRADVQYNTINQLQINLMQAPPGVYFIRVRNGRNDFSGKLLKLAN